MCVCVCRRICICRDRAARAARCAFNERSFALQGGGGGSVNITQIQRARVHMQLSRHTFPVLCVALTLAHSHTCTQTNTYNLRPTTTGLAKCSYDARRPTTNVNGFRSSVALLAHSHTHTGATTSPPDSVVLQRLHSNENECVRECVCVL